MKNFSILLKRIDWYKVTLYIQLLLLLVIFAMLIWDVMSMYVTLPTHCQSTRKEVWDNIDPVVETRELSEHVNKVKNGELSELDSHIKLTPIDYYHCNFIETKCRNECICKAHVDLKVADDLYMRRIGFSSGFRWNGTCYCPQFENMDQPCLSHNVLLNTSKEPLGSNVVEGIQKRMGIPVDKIKEERLRAKIMFKPKEILNLATYRENETLNYIIEDTINKTNISEQKLDQELIYPWRKSKY